MQVHLASYDKPLPVADDDSQGFWEGARNHRLAFQRCQHCGTFAHPPAAFCERCHNLAEPSFAFEAVSGRGRIVNWTIMRQAMVAGFEGDVPWVHALIEIDEQPGLLYACALEDGPSDLLKIGAPVQVTFHDVTPEVTIPYFMLVSSTGSGC